MADKNILALDESVRHIDKNGHLVVKESVITKESVDPYYGRDIPDFERRGLDPDKIYYLYRPIDEIERAIDTFKGKQLLFKHTQVDSEDMKKGETIGAIGSDLKVKDGKLYGDMTFWDQEAINLINAKKMEQLSNGYWYDVDMTEGDFDGTKYDGRMFDLHGNHVALVKRGRIGDDAIICDEQTVEGLGMNKLLKFKKGSMPKIKAAMQLALDEDFTEESVKEVVKTIDDSKEGEVSHDSGDIQEKLGVSFDGDQVAKIMEILGGISKPAHDEQTQAERDNKSEAMRIKEREEREAVDRKKDEGTAMDSAMIEQIESNTTKRVTALFEARKEVEPIVGVVAMDSADEVYKFTLEQKGIAIDGVHPSAYKAMVGLLQKQAPQTIAQDSAPNYGSVAELAPHIKLN